MGETLLTQVIYGIQTERGHKVLDRLEADSKEAIAYSERLLLKLMEDNKDTVYGQKYHFADVHSIEDYKRLVPFSDYDDYAPYISEMIYNNAHDLITSYPVIHYAITSGSVGVPKHIPVSDKAINIYKRYTTEKIFATSDDYYKKMGLNRRYGRGLNMLEAKPMFVENGTPKGAISGTTSGSIKQFLPHATTTPINAMFPKRQMDMKYVKARFALAEKNPNFMAAGFMTMLVDIMQYIQNNWEMLCDDIEKGIISADIKMDVYDRKCIESKISPDPERAAELRREFKKGFDTPIIPRIWKNMAWVCAIGTGGFVPYTEKFRAFLGNDIPIDFGFYASSEALIAISKAVEETSFVLIPESGFFEFIPMDSEDEETTYTIDQLEVGKEYEIIVTNISGFYRYRIKDVIRVTGFYNQAPMIEFVYRKNQMISIAGEKTNESSVAWSISEFTKETGCEVVDYSVYADTESDPGRYVVLIEPAIHVDKSKHEEYRKIIEEKLSIANPSLGAKLETGLIGPTKLVFLQSQTYLFYRDMMIMKGTSPNQLKPVRVIDNPKKEKFFFSLIDEE